MPNTKPFKSPSGTHMIYPSGVPDKEFPKGYEGTGSKYQHPKSVEEAVWNKLSLKPKTGKTSEIDPRSGYNWVKIEDIKKSLDILEKMFLEKYK